MKNIVLCDIDGTIANIDHRVHLLKDKPVDWEAFYKDAHKDAPIHEMLDLIDALFEVYDVNFITARSENERALTNKWLTDKLLFIRFPCLIMRKNGDHRCDSIVKVERALEEGYTPDRVAFVLEDRTRVVKAWRAAGYRCLQVAEGDF
jgi:hypothetical protein